MSAWSTDDSSSDSDNENENTNAIKSGNTTHSSYDYWQQYYQKRKQNNIKQKMNSNQRSYHKYQRNFISSKTGNISNYHLSSPHNTHTNYKSKPSLPYSHGQLKINTNKLSNAANNKLLTSLTNNKHTTNANLTHARSTHSSNKSNTSNVIHRNPFNSHIVSTSVDTYTDHSHNTHNTEDVISPFLRVQQNKKKMPYNYSYSSLHAALGATPSASSTNFATFSSIQMNQLQQPINITYTDRHSSCMKSTQAASLSSLMFTTPQKFTYFQQHRHLYFHHEEFTKQRREFVKQWRAKEKDKRAMRTEGIILSLCLNIGVDPPDIVRTNPCAVYECWMNPAELPASRALEVIAKRLEQQYSAWKGKSRKQNIKKILDGNPELVRQTCGHLRQYATDRRVIFHYNGHGVPRPTEHGELWFFNATFSEYLPVSILDIAQWLQTPSLIILDCSGAGKIVSSFKQYEPLLKQQKYAQVVDNKKKHRGTVDESDYTDTASLYRFGTMILAACDENEILPMNPSYPADIFTSCLTSPIKMALKWFISTQLLHDKNNVNIMSQQDEKTEEKKGDEKDNYEHKFSRDGDVSNNNYMALLDMIFDESIGGRREDKKNILGELHWIFLSVTDTIAWNVLPNKLFQNLFRLDYTIQSLFRNYLLAERIMKSMNRNPISYPALPNTNNHPMWQSWDSAVDAALLQLKQYINTQNQWRYQQLIKLKMSQKSSKNSEEKKESVKKKRFTSSNSGLIEKEPELKWKASTFFEQQLRAFEVWIDSCEVQKKPYHLPIVLQALLNKSYRLKALTLLSRYLDLGPWTVNYVLWVGLHSYFKLLLKGAIADENGNNKTLRYSLTFIWAKILAHDPSCRHDLIVGKHYVFFYRELKRKDNSDQQIYLSTFILTQIASYQPTGQKVLLSKACGGIKKSSANSLLNILKTNIFHPNNNIKIWSILCIAKIWENLDEIKCIAYDITDVLLLQLSSLCIEVRAVTMYALGTFFNLRDIPSNAPTNNDILGPNMDLNLAHQLTKLVHDPSPIIRMELVFVLSSLIYYQQEQFREYYNKQKMIKKEQKRRAREEQQSMKIYKSQSNYSLKPKKSLNFFSKSLNKKHTHSESLMNINTANIRVAHSQKHQYTHSSQYNPPSLVPSLQTTQSVPPKPKLPELQTGKGAKSAFNPSLQHKFSGTSSGTSQEQSRISPMIAPLNPNEIPTAPNSTDNNSNKSAHSQNSDTNIDEEYEQRKRIWEVIKVLCKDPIAEISRNANKVKTYMTSDKVKSSRSRALSDPEKHAKLIKDKHNGLKFDSDSLQRASSDYSMDPKPNGKLSVNKKLKQASHSKANTIFGALSGGIGSKSKSKKQKTHRKIASQQINYNNIPQKEKKNMKGKNAFLVSHDSESLKSDDPNWGIPDSPLFSWLTEYISRPLTNAMYDAPDPLYHELDPKNLPLIDPRLTMSNFFYHQEQQKYDQEQKLVAKRYEENSGNPSSPPNDDSDYLYGIGSRGSISEYFRSGGSSSFKLRYGEMNETLALNYSRLAAIRSWETRKFYMFAERARSIWKQLLNFVDPTTYSYNQNNLALSTRHSPQIKHSKSVASSPNPSHNHDASFDERLASTSFTLPSGMIAEDNKPRERSLSNDYGSFSNKTASKKKKILSFLGGNSNKNKDNSDNLGSSYDGNKYLSPTKKKKIGKNGKNGKKHRDASNNNELSHSLDAITNKIEISDYNSNPSPLNTYVKHSYNQPRTPQSTRSVTNANCNKDGSDNKPSPYISPYNFSDTDSIDFPHVHHNDINFESSYSSFCRENDYYGNNLTQKSAAQFIKTGMRINNQIERYDTECNNGITAIKFHPFRNILYCADANGRVWVWKYEGNIGANNPNNKRRINLINIKDTHLSNAPLLNGSMHSANISGSHSYNYSHSHSGNTYGNIVGHSQSVGNFSDVMRDNYEEKKQNYANDDISHSHSQRQVSNDSSSSSSNVVVTSFEIINAYHDTMLLCAGDDGTIRIYRNSHLENSMSAVTAFLANARIKPTRQQQQIHYGQRDSYGYGSGGKMITSFCSEYGYLYTGGSHNSVKIHDCHNEAYFGNYYTKCNTTSILIDETHKNLLITGCVDNRVRLFDLRADLNKNTCTKEMQILFSNGVNKSHPKILSIKPTHSLSNNNCYYICSTQELLLFDLRNSAIITRIPFKKSINTFDSHKYAPIYALGSTKQFVQICSSLKLDSTSFKSFSANPKNNSSKNKQQMQSVNEICYHDGFLGARIGPVRLLKFHPYKLLLAVGGTNKHLSLYSSSNSKNNSLL